MSLPLPILIVRRKTKCKTHFFANCGVWRVAVAPERPRFSCLFCHTQAEVTPGLISLATQVRVKDWGVNNFYKWMHFSFLFSCSDSLAFGTSENTGLWQLEGHVGLCQAVYERD